MHRVTSVLPIDSSDDLIDIARGLRDSAPPVLDELVNVCERWSAALTQSQAKDVPGAVFLSLWLRRNTIESIIERELRNVNLGEWEAKGNIRLKRLPLGIVGHWPAANVEVLPVLSMICSLLAGNTALVRVPPRIVETVQRVIAPLNEVDSDAIMTRRIALVSYGHERIDLQETMAQLVDGAMIWGGRESVLDVRALPFPTWARILAFGPRISVAAMDRQAWSDPNQCQKWCLRLARDVWQFEQQACSSPQVLFCENPRKEDLSIFLQSLADAFRSENRQHPRMDLSTTLASTIVKARASCLLDDAANQALFPTSPDWTILVHHKPNLPEPTQGRTLHVVPVRKWSEMISLLDGNVQTLGLGMTDPDAEVALADLTAARGIDRIVRLGIMHVFDSPWDGSQLIAPLTRLIRYSSSVEE